MSDEYKKGPHTVYDIQYHFVWVTRYRYHTLKGEVALRARDLIQQKCEARCVTVLSGHVSKDHIHIHVSCPRS
jgi:putative transposase